MPAAVIPATITAFATANFSLPVISAGTAIQSSTTRDPRTVNARTCLTTARAGNTARAAIFTAIYCAIFCTISFIAATCSAVIYSAATSRATIASTTESSASSRMGSMQDTLPSENIFPLLVL
jgi:hypothetical protein